MSSRKTDNLEEKRSDVLVTQLVLLDTNVTLSHETHYGEKRLDFYRPGRRPRGADRN